MKYLFYIEGLEREVWQESETERLAKKKLWESLSEFEQDHVVQIECIDEEIDEDNYHAPLFTT